MNEISIALPHIELAAYSHFSAETTPDVVYVFVHGYLDNAASFSPLFPYFEDYNWLAFDLAGHGKSQHRSIDAHYHLVDYAYDLHQLISTLKHSKIILVGHSLGAIVCSIYAATKPKNVIGFVAIESMGPLAENEDTTASQLEACFASRNKAKRPIKQPDSIEQLVKARMAVSDLSAENAKLIMTRNTQLGDNAGSINWSTDKRLRTKSPMRMTEKQACDILQHINCPRLVILGANGFEKVKLGIKTRAKYFNNIDRVELKGGHHVHMESPFDVANSILQWSADLL